MPDEKGRKYIHKARRQPPVPEQYRTPEEPRIGGGEGLVVLPQYCRRISGTDLAIYMLR